MSPVQSSLYPVYHPTPETMGILFSLDSAAYPAKHSMPAVTYHLLEQKRIISMLIFYRSRNAFTAWLCCLLLFSGTASAQLENPRSQAKVMWALSGVLPRDRAHWIRNFDFYQMVPGIASMPVDILPEDPASNFQPGDLRRIAASCDEAGCRFFFVVQHGDLSEQIHSSREGKRKNYQQEFRQTVTLSAYRKAPNSEVWEKITPVRGSAEDKDYIGTSDVPSEQRALNINRQRCEFLRKVPAQTAATLVGRMLVEIKKLPKSGINSGPDIFEYSLTNRSPLKLSTLYIWVPVATPRNIKEQEFLFGEGLNEVGTLDPYETKFSSLTLNLKGGGKPQTNRAWVTVDGWSQEELDNSRARRKKLPMQRSDWQEHENLPPPAHQMNWETEEGE